MSKTYTMLLRCKTLGAKGDRQLLGAAKHNLREIGGAHIAEERSHLNVVLAGPESAAEVARTAASRTSALAASDEALAHKLARKNRTRAVEFIFGLPASTPVDTLAYFTACLSWVENTFGDVVLSAVIHYDETAPHAHVLMLPMRGGAWLGSDVLGKRADIQSMHTDFARAVGCRFGVKQAPARLSGNDKAAAVAAVFAQLRAQEDPVLHSHAWPVIRELIEADPRPFAEQLGIQVRIKLRTMAQLKVSRGRGAERDKSSIDDFSGVAENSSLVVEDAFPSGAQEDTPFDSDAKAQHIHAGKSMCGTRDPLEPSDLAADRLAAPVPPLPPMHVDEAREASRTLCELERVSRQPGTLSNRRPGVCRMSPANPHRKTTPRKATSAPLTLASALGFFQIAEAQLARPP